MGFETTQTCNAHAVSINALSTSAVISAHAGVAAPCSREIYSSLKVQSSRTTMGIDMKPIARKVFGEQR